MIKLDQTYKKCPLRHLAIIMDGNGRWARSKGYPRIVGHKVGVSAVERIVRAAANRNIRYITLYAFSTENWNRPKPEVMGLMALFRYYIKSKIVLLKDEEVRLRFAGLLEGLPSDVQEILRMAEAATENCKRIDMIVCMNYGGRSEIVNSVNKFIALHPGEEISEDDIRHFLHLPDVPDPDLIIRTSGELRLSNFLLWQSAYSEFYFTDTLWPEFSEKDLDLAIKSFSERERRYGKV